MTTFDRRRTILRFIQERGSANVADLAAKLNVSEGTIRNDLTALEAEQLLVRVRGGAVLKNGQLIPSSVVTRARVNFDAKQRIARWAADLVDDGDAILLDASTTVLSIASFLHEHKNLTVITNGVEVARTLAQNYSNTVILIGGVMQPDGNTITSTLGESMLKDLYIKTAFVSCAGFTMETGLTEADIRQAQLKSQMIRYASRIVALVDSSKFGRVGLAPFAAANQISQIVTDDGIDAEMVEQLMQAKIGLTICGAESVDSIMPHVVETRTHTIGFANLSEDIPFAVDVRRSLERAAQNANVDLVLADNQLSGETALNVADHLIARGVELVIEYQIDEKIGNVIINKFHQANIPVIAVDIPMVGATYFGVDNYHAGHLAGVALGKWIKNQWQNRVDALLVLEEPRTGTLTGARIQGQLNGLSEVIGQNALSNTRFLDSGNTRDISEANVLSALQTMPDQHHIAVICFNDDAAIGALTAARRLHREQDVVIVGQGADRRVREEIRKPASRIIGSTAFTPEKYGDKLIDLALRILRGEHVPPAVYVEHTFVDAGNIRQFYPD